MLKELSVTFYPRQSRLGWTTRVSDSSPHFSALSLPCFLHPHHLSVNQQGLLLHVCGSGIRYRKSCGARFLCSRSMQPTGSPLHYLQDMLSQGRGGGGEPDALGGLGKREKFSPWSWERFPSWTGLRGVNGVSSSRAKNRKSFWKGRVSPLKKSCSFW